MAFDRLLADQLNTTQERYNLGIERNIKENARITRKKKFFAEHSDAQEIIDFLEPLSREWQNNGFLTKMAFALDEWGSLTEGQLAPVRKAMAKAKERNAKFEKMKAERAAKSNYVGTVGVRQEFVLKVVYVHAFEGVYGWSYINICHDADENVVVYKGTQDWGKGSEVTCMAKIKNHDVREGEKQTIIQRPTKVTINGEAY